MNPWVLDVYGPMGEEKGWRLAAKDMELPNIGAVIVMTSNPKGLARSEMIPQSKYHDDFDIFLPIVFCFHDLFVDHHRTSSC